MDAGDQDSGALGQGESSSVRVRVSSEPRDLRTGLGPDSRRPPRRSDSRPCGTRTWWKESGAPSLPPGLLQCGCVPAAAPRWVPPHPAPLRSQQPPLEAPFFPASSQERGAHRQNFLSLILLSPHLAPLFAVVSFPPPSSVLRDPVLLAEGNALLPCPQGTLLSISKSWGPWLVPVQPNSPHSCRGCSKALVCVKNECCFGSVPVPLTLEVLPSTTSLLGRGINWRSTPLTREVETPLRGWAPGESVLLPGAVVWSPCQW